MSAVIVSGEQGQHSLLCMVDLKHGVGEELEELLHLESGVVIREGARTRAPSGCRRFRRREGIGMS